MRRIWETLMFRDEFEMLAMHLEETPWIHRYVLVEAPWTHRGQFKPVHYRDSGLTDERVIPVVAEIPQAALGTPWAIEHIQRDAALPALEAAGCALDDLVIIGDIDKIPSEAVRNWAGWNAAAINMRTTMYAVDWEVPAEHLPPQGIVATLRWIKARGGLSAVMDTRFGYPAIANGGWHFSWLGGPDKQAEKLDTGTCHTEILGTEEETLIRSGERYRTGVDGGSLPVVAVDVDESWPAMIRERRCPPEWFRPKGES